MPEPDSQLFADTASGTREPLIQMDVVSKHFHVGATTVAALDRLSLDVPPGQFIAVTGRSGSGKSTLLHLLAAMDAPTTGRLQVGPWHVTALTRKHRARYRRDMVGMIFQQFNLIPSMDALQNVELPLILAGVSERDRRSRAEQCLALVDLTHRLHHRPAELSGGEQQRVAIARALVHDPPLLLADEPTGNLDSTTAGHILRLLARVHREQGKTVVLVTHNLGEARSVSERIVRLRDGRLVEDEQPSA